VTTLSVPRTVILNASSSRHSKLTLASLYVLAAHPEAPRTSAETATAQDLNPLHCESVETGRLPQIVWVSSVALGQVLALPLTPATSRPYTTPVMFIYVPSNLWHPNFKTRADPARFSHA